MTTTTRDDPGTSLWNDDGIFDVIVVVVVTIVAVLHVRRRPPDVAVGRRGYLTLAILQACADTQSNDDGQQCRRRNEDDRQPLRPPTPGAGSHDGGWRCVGVVVVDIVFPPVAVVGLGHDGCSRWIVFRNQSNAMEE